MRVPKQGQNSPSQQSLVPHHSVVGTNVRPAGKSPQSSPLVQTLSRVGDGANASNHAAILNRAPERQLPANTNLLIHLQRQYGNRYVNQVVTQAQRQDSEASQQPPLQTKLTIGPAGDKYEREADQVASEVVQQINAPAARPSGQPQTVQRQAMPDELQAKPQITAIQRQAMPGGKEEEEKQKLAKKKLEKDAQLLNKKQEEEKKHQLTNKTLAKDKLHQHKQIKEEEKDKLAKKTAGPDTLHPHQKPEEEEEKLLAQKKSAGADHAKKLDEDDDKLLAQKKPAMGAHASHEKPEEEDEQHHAQMKAVVQRLATGGETATANVESSIKQARGQGSPLPDQFRGSIENAFGADFSGVRIHTDDRADRLNHAVQARAFTTGQDIFLRPGEYALGSKRGQELIAHELTHVVQQNGSAVQPKSIARVAKKANKMQPKSADANDSGREAAIAEPKGQGALWTAPAMPGDASGQEIQPLAVEVRGGTAKLQRQAAGDASPESSEADPGYQEVVSQAHGVGTKEKEHQPAGEKSQEAQDAAEPPSNEVESKAQDKQVDEMGNAPTPPFDPVAFKKALMDKIKNAAPKNLDEADKFKDSNKLESVKNDVTGKVDESQKESQGPLEEKTKAAPDTSGITPKPVTPLPSNQPGETPSISGAEKAAPKSKGQSQVEAPVQARSQSLDEQLAGADITEEQLAKSNEPQFQSALDSKKTAQTHSETAPQAYRQGEQSQLSQAESTAAATAQEKLQGMHGERSQSLEQVTGKQVDGKGKDEESRTKIARDIDKIYQTTKTKVDTKLAKLTTDVVAAFDAGAAEAKKGFEEYVGKRMDAYKADRYTTSWSNPFGWAKWVNDKLWGMPEEVNRFYEEGRDLYIKNMDGVIDRVVTIVGTKLTEAKNDVAEGRKQVKEYVAQLPEDLKAIGEEAATNIQSQFDGLEQDIQSKQDELIDTLAQKYKENLDAIDARIKEMQEENKGLIEKAIDFVVGVIETIVELAKMLLQVLARVASVIGSILKDPIGFLSNLFNALKLGFTNFVKNIGKHLTQGLLGWLTGALAMVNIQIPTLDIQGIFSLVMQVLGINSETIRAMVHERLGQAGEKLLGILENLEEFKLMLTQGVAGVWQAIKDGLGDLKAMVLDPIINFIKDKVIVAGVQWILSLMNPAAAFIKACKAIYDIIKFFMERAQQIADLINTILDSLELIVKGDIAQAAQAVEDSLAKSIPVAIEFLATVVGVGGLSAMVLVIIKKQGKTIKKAIELVINKGIKAAKVIAQKLQKAKLAKKLKAAKEAARKKKEAAQKMINKKKQALEKRYQEAKNKLLKSKAGKKQLDALKKMRDAAKKKLDAAKNKPAKQLAKLLGRKDKKQQGNDQSKAHQKKDTQKTNQIDHKRLAKKAVRELEKTDGKAKDYKTLRSAKQVQAKQIEKSYTQKLEKGIKLTVRFEDATKDEKDGKLNFKVVIAPNCTIEPGYVDVSTIVTKFLKKHESPSTAPEIFNKLINHAKPGNYDGATQLNESSYDSNTWNCQTLSIFLIQVCKFQKITNAELDQSNERVVSVSAIKPHMDKFPNGNVVNPRNPERKASWRTSFENHTWTKIDGKIYDPLMGKTDDQITNIWEGTEKKGVIKLDSTRYVYRKDGTKEGLLYRGYLDRYPLSVQGLRVLKYKAIYKLPTPEALKMKKMNYLYLLQQRIKGIPID
jgi:hypothetical protein